MNAGFWGQLRKPFFALAPMADVTDAAFRSIIARYSRHGELNGGPDVFYTEFVSCAGLLSEGREILSSDLRYSEAERPIVAQLFGSDPLHFYQCAQLIAELGFDGVDINMGCPDRSVEKQGAGAALIKDPARAQAIIRETKRGAGDLPVSVKTRLGYRENEINTWIMVLLAEQPAALIVHGRTRKEMSKVPARWDNIARVVDIARESGTLIIGNGDVASLEDGIEKARLSGADGVMVGRGVFGNPWFFDKGASPDTIPLEKRLRVMLEHTRLFEEMFAGMKNFSVIKKHYRAYVSGFNGAKELRMALMQAHNADDADRIVKNFICDIKH